MLALTLVVCLPASAGDDPAAAGDQTATPASAPRTGGVGGLVQAAPAAADKLAVELSHELGKPKGALDAAQLETAVSRIHGQLRFCYERQLAKEPSLAGDVEVALVIGADGKVSSTAVAEDGLGSSEVGSCVEGRLKRVVFPKGKKGTKVDLVVHFSTQAAAAE
jgi:uncharacterized protein YfaP (DUF2135 family)